MKRVLLALGFSAMLSGTAIAETYPVSMYTLDTFTKLLSTALQERAKELGITVKVDDAREDPARQIEQVKAALAAKPPAIIVTPPNDEVAAQIDALAAAANVPVVFMNVQPNLDRFLARTAIVASNDLVAGRMQMRYVGKLIGNKGNVAVLTGPSGHPAAIGRTNGVKEVVNSLPGLSLKTVVAANWKRDEAKAVVTGWISAGTLPNAILANNDDMALGALDALQAAGIPDEQVVVAGVDATPAALASMKENKLDVTVLQNAVAQGRRSADDAVALAKGQPVQLYDWIPYELVIPSNVADYAM
ncbi:substrate-binding domain-containing protein [Pannonibacter tanglangensis]|uniref:Substrate-binding domain-containing protein n=1 Tax=Pannonibacter tanglangensis TaxID=2750084 RepID=A0ABW9ZD03_9HYPH|nr:substrate-binding domain-containing protein [Pannonibacter sp. XCT-34]NBN62725.1 substrate-binding domain-containing protein [Pannonibacter sp. XCT-34]